MYCNPRMFLLRSILSILGLVVSSIALIGQEWRFNEVNFRPQQYYTFVELIDSIQSQQRIVISYKNSLIDSRDSLYLNTDRYTIVEILDKLGELNQFGVKYKSRKKALLYPLENIGMINFFGYLKDSQSKGPIPSAFVYHNDGSTYTDDHGFFSLAIPNIASSLQSPVILNAVGYQSDTTFITKNVPVIIDLDHINVVDTLFVRSNYLYPGSNGNEDQILDLDNPLSYSDVSGDRDVISGIRFAGGYDIGGEGRHGLSIRGGSPDQTLILIDEIPIFEFSHLGGQQSIFISDIVQGASFHASGLPAQYGGKLSSVVDIKLKQPNLTKTEVSLGQSFSATNATINTPLIPNKVGIIASARKSILNVFASGIAKSALNYNTLDLAYDDFYVKTVYAINASHRISGLAYSGSDAFETERQITLLPSEEKTYNQLKWGNLAYGLNYNGVLNDNWAVKASINSSQYTFNTRGSFLGASTQSPSFDVLSRSSNTSENIKVELKHYANNRSKTAIGYQYSNLSFSPSIFQSGTYRDDSITSLPDVQSTFAANDQAFYIQNTSYILGSSNTLHTGLRIVNYNSQNYQTIRFEPRVKISLDGDDINFIAKFGINHQPIHLLVNPGLGLPSDLWFPSNESLQPQRVQEFSLTLNFKLEENQVFSASAYSKNYSNVTEYTNIQDLYYNTIDPQSILNLPIERLNVIDNLTQGDEVIRGGELTYRLNGTKVQAWLNYALTYATRQFESLNNGNPYPSRYDRRHNMTVGAALKLAKNKGLFFKWNYGSGYPYTIINEVFVINGEVVPVIAVRNNERTPDFHHLDIMYNYRKQFDKFEMELSAGIYNVYSRKNPFYIYLRQSEDSPIPEKVQVSLFPILPTCKLSIHL